MLSTHMHTLMYRKQQGDEHRQALAQLHSEMARLQQSHRAQMTQLQHERAMARTDQSEELSRLRLQLQVTNEQYAAVMAALQARCAAFCATLSGLLGLNKLSILGHF